MELSKYLRDYSRTIPGKQQLLIGAYAKALEIIPRQLCDNAGFDATNILNKLRAKHAQVGPPNIHFCLILNNTGTRALLWPAVLEVELEIKSNLCFICHLTAGWCVVRCGHQQRGHCRQLHRLRLGAIHRADQCSDGSVRGSLSHLVSR